MSKPNNSLKWTASPHNSKNIRFYHSTFGKTMMMLSYFRPLRKGEACWKVSVIQEETPRRVIATGKTRKECEENLSNAIANTMGLMAL